MKQFLRRLQKLLQPRGWLLFLLTVLSAAGLSAVFIRGLEQTFIACLLYPLSAYTFAALTFRAVSCFRGGYGWLLSKPWFRRYRTDLDFKASVSIHLSFGITLLYSAYKAALGIHFRSSWFGSMALYYSILGIQRFSLLRRLRKEQQDPVLLWRQYRFCGALLLALTAALGIMSFHAVIGGETPRYPGPMIYGAAAFTFYNLVMAALNLNRFRKANNPLYTAGRLLSLAAAMISLFFLQVSLLAVFGSGSSWQRLMNIAFGGCVFLLVLGMAVYMLRKSSRAIRKLHQE